MSIFKRIASDDPMRRVLLSTGVLFSSNSLSLALSVVQSILAARLLGPAGFGLLAIVMAYASTVNGLLSFRMGELVVRYGGEFLEKEEKGKTAALVKAAAASEALVSALAFVVVVISAGLASAFIAKTPGSAELFFLYGLGLLANFNTETSRGVLQALDKIKLEGVINLAQSLLTAGMIAAAFVSGGDVLSVLYAYLAGKVVLGLGLFMTAVYHLTRRLGADWWRAPLSALPGFGGLARFAVTSNLSATVILIFRESELLWVGYFLTTEAAGFYKAAYAIAGLLAVPANPFILTTYPEINRLVVQKAWPRLREFLRRITSVAAVYNLMIAAGFVIFGRWLLSFYGDPYRAAYPALLALLVGLVFNYILFWNRPLLLSLGLPEFPLKATLAAGITKMALAFALVPRLGYVAEAALLSFYYIASVAAIVWRGLNEIRSREDLNREDAKDATTQ